MICDEIQSGGLLKRYIEHVDNLFLENKEKENDDELLNDNPGVSTGSRELKKRTQMRIIRSVWRSST